MKVIDDGSGRQVKQEVMVQGVYVLLRQRAGV